MKCAFDSGSYSLRSGDGGVLFVRIDGDTLMFFDHPTDPLRGNLRIQERDFKPSLDDQTAHPVDDDVLVFQQPGGERRLKLTLDDKP